MKIQITLGIASWLGLFIFERPPANSHDWATLLMLLAALVWLPMALHILWFKKQELFSLRLELLRYGALPSALTLAGATLFPQGWQAAALALPWLGITLLVFSMGFEKLNWDIWQQPGELAVAAACLFLPIGSFSAFADRLDWQPLGFDPAIVLLTGVHFHYAGFLFPLICGLAALHFSKKALRLACRLAVLAVPMTAVGITVAQLWQDFLIEAFAAATVALAGWCCATGYFQIVFSEKISPAVRVMWGMLSLSLVFTMTLALLYALRPWFPLEWLNIPSMRAWHGTVNALGAAGCGILGWLIRVDKG